MDEKISGAIEVLLTQVSAKTQEISELKKMVNQLRRLNGEDPMFHDIDDAQTVPTAAIRADQYYGKPLSTSVQDYLERRNQACSIDEILRGLEQGSFDFRSLGWKDNDRVRSLSITLVKNSKVFHRLPNGTFGLLAWYDQAMLKKAEKQVAQDKEAALNGSISEQAEKKAEGKEPE